MTKIETLKSNLRIHARKRGHTLDPFRASEHNHPWGPTFTLPRVNNVTTYGARCKTCGVLIIINETESWTARNDRALSQACKASAKQAPFFRRIK